MERSARLDVRSDDGIHRHLLRRSQDDRLQLGIIGDALQVLLR
jgi:hypothetical protein